MVPTDIGYASIRDMDYAGRRRLRRFFATLQPVDRRGGRETMAYQSELETDRRDAVRYLYARTGRKTIRPIRGTNFSIQIIIINVYGI